MKARAAAIDQLLDRDGQQSEKQRSAK